MYAAVNRKFHTIFNRQEVMKTFKVYDRMEVNKHFEMQYMFIGT